MNLLLVHTDHKNYITTKFCYSAINCQELYFLCDSETPGGVSENRELAKDPDNLNSTAVSGYESYF